MQKDYYKILGIPKNSSQEEIKKAYYKLAHLYHPDKKGGDETKFKEINEAYQVLSNKEKRAQYDKFGTTNGQQYQGSGFSGFNWEDFSHGFEGLEDIFDIFGNDFSGFRQKEQDLRRGADLEVELEIPLESVQGAKAVELNQAAQLKNASAAEAKEEFSKSKKPFLAPLLIMLFAQNVKEKE